MRLEVVRGRISFSLTIQGEQQCPLELAEYSQLKWA